MENYFFIKTEAPPNMKRLLLSLPLAIAVFSNAGCDLDPDFAALTLSCVQDASCESCTTCDCAACGDCEGCALTPAAFATTDRMPNAAQVRLSRSGLDFIENNALAVVGGVVEGMDPDSLPIAITYADGTLSLPLNNSLLEGADLPTGVSISLCPNNNCSLDVSLTSLTITPTDNSPDSPDSLDIDLQIDLSSNRPTPLSISAVIVTRNCTFDFQTDHDGPPTLNVSASAHFSEDADGYGRGETPSLVVDTASFNGRDLQLVCPQTGWPGSASELYFGLEDGSDPDPYDGNDPNIPDDDEMALDIFAEVEMTLNQAMAELMAKLFTYCQSSWNGQCPAGSSEQGGVCIQDGTSECVPARLGVEGNIDATDLLSQIFPGTPLELDMLFAMQGEARAETNGFNLDFFAGFQNTAGIAECVADIELQNPPTLPTDIPLSSVIQTSEDAHVVVGVSERMMDWAGYQMWEGGTLCIDAGTRLSSLLSTGLFSVLVRSLRTVTFPSSEAPLGIAVRPANPPEITIGVGTAEDPLIQVDLAALDLHFYVWNAERYSRFMTYTSDLHLGINLEFNEMGEITPVIAEIETTNDSVTNSELVSESPETLSTAVGNVFPIISGFAADLLPTIDPATLLGDSLPIGVTLDANTLRQVVEGSDRFLGVFVNLEDPNAAAASGFVGRVDTTVEVVSVNVPDESALKAESFGQGERPEVELAFGATGPSDVDYEFQYRLDGMPWSEWSASSYAVADANVLLAQGVHTVYARARVAGVADSRDGTPAEASFSIDVLPPIVEVNGNSVAAMDVVSQPDALEYRYRRADEEEFSAWATMGENTLTLAGIGPGEDVIVEVRDEVGNVGGNAAALRGLPPPSDGGGCSDCSVDGSSSSRPLSGALMLLVLFALVRRPRREGGA